MRRRRAPVAAGGVARAFLRKLGSRSGRSRRSAGSPWTRRTHSDPRRGRASVARCAAPDPDRRDRDDRPGGRGPVPAGTPSAACSRWSRAPASRSAWVVRPLGPPAWTRALAAAVMSINIVKGVEELGLGFDGPDGSARRSTTSSRDAATPGAGSTLQQRRRLTGGVTNGEPIVVRRRSSPSPPWPRPLPSADPAHRRSRRQGPLRAPATSAWCRRRRSIGEAMVMLTLARLRRSRSSAATPSRRPGEPWRQRARLAATLEPPVAGATVRGDGHLPGAGHGPPARTSRLRRRRLDRTDGHRPRRPAGRDGKSVVGKRLAHRHGADFVDLDERIEHEDDRSIPRAVRRTTARRRSEARAARGPFRPRAPDDGPNVRRVIATGGGAPIDRATDGSLYRGRLPIWLDSRPEVLAQRLRRCHTCDRWSTGDRPVRRATWPFVRERDLLRRGLPVLRRDRGDRRRRRGDRGSPRGCRRPWRRPPSCRRTRPRPDRDRRRHRGPPASVEAPRRLEARRAILVSESEAVGWASAGHSRRPALAGAGRDPPRPSPRARRQAAGDRRGGAASDLARLRVERESRSWASGVAVTRRHGRLPRGHLPARSPADPRADDASSPDRFRPSVVRPGEPAGRQEPRRGVPPAATIVIMSPPCDPAGRQRRCAGEA